MSRFFDNRLGHYLLVAFVAAILTLPQLGATSLWDIDEGLNAEAAREMVESENWIVPEFNFQPRNAKPVLLYWLQATAYEHLGVNEFAARLPSALASILVALVIYELGRRMYDAPTGLFAALILASSIQFCLLAHAATPDMLLLLGVVLALALFWHGYTYDRRLWLVTTSIGAGIAVLAKGPVGVVLPVLIITLFLFSRGELKRYFNWRFFVGSAIFATIALPWYILVGSETRGAFLRSFWWNENVNRFLSPQESHTGPIYYYPLVLVLGFAPWCVFMAPTLWNGWREARDESDDSRWASRFLILWGGAYFCFFSAAATKLPNYILPSYPAFALLTARALRCWQAGELELPAWIMPTCLLTYSTVGIVTAVVLIVASGIVPLAPLKGNAIPGLERWAMIGLIPIAAALVAWHWDRQRLQRRSLATLAASAVAFLALLIVFPIRIIDARKAPKELVTAAGLCQPEAEIRIASYAYFQPSLVFYAQREVKELRSELAALDFLESPMPGYLICPAKSWNELSSKTQGMHKVLARRHDLYRNYEVVVVSNR